MRKKIFVKYLQIKWVVPSLHEKIKREILKKPHGKFNYSLTTYILTKALLCCTSESSKE